MNNHPTFAWMLLEHLSAQLRRMTERVFDFSTLVVRKRLIRELFRRAEEIGPVNGQVSIARRRHTSSWRQRSARQRGGFARDERPREGGADERRGGGLVLHDLAALEMLAVTKE